jgi:hypothetical protein
MAFIHKYTIGDDIFYRVTKGKAGPSKIVTITRENWKGVSAGSNVQNAIKFLDSLTFSKDVEEKEPQVKEDKKSSLTMMVRSIASKCVEAK